MYRCILRIRNFRRSFDVPAVTTLNLGRHPSAVMYTFSIQRYIGNDLPWYCRLLPIPRLLVVLNVIMPFGILGTCPTTLLLS